MAELFLWDHPVSPFSCKIRIALREKNIPFKIETPKGAGSGAVQAGPGTFAEDNLRLEVPKLVVNGNTTIVDSTIIFEYLEDNYPEVPLRPTEPLARAKARMIEDVCDTQFEAINWGLGELTVFKRGAGLGDLVQAMKEKAKSQIQQIHDWLTQQLGDAEWFGGDKFGYADVCVWPFMNSSTRFAIQPATGTPLRDWFDRVSERPAVKSVREEFQASLPGLSLAYEYLQKGLFKREYRDSRLEWMIKTGGIDIVEEGLEKDNIRFQWPIGEHKL